MKITKEDRAEWLMRLDTIIEVYNCSDGSWFWRARQKEYAGYDARTKTAAINAAIRAERKVKGKG